MRVQELCLQRSTAAGQAGEGVDCKFATGAFLDKSQEPSRCSLSGDWPAGLIILKLLIGTNNGLHCLYF